MKFKCENYENDYENITDKEIEEKNKLFSQTIELMAKMGMKLGNILKEQQKIDDKLWEISERVVSNEKNEYDTEKNNKIYSFYCELNKLITAFYEEIREDDEKHEIN